MGAACTLICVPIRGPVRREPDDRARRSVPFQSAPARHDPSLHDLLGREGHAPRDRMIRHGTVPPHPTEPRKVDPQSMCSLRAPATSTPMRRCRRSRVPHVCSSVVVMLPSRCSHRLVQACAGKCRLIKPNRRRDHYVSENIKTSNPRSCVHFNRVITAHVWPDQEVVALHPIESGNKSPRLCHDPCPPLATCVTE